jgi:hypothetical protein
MSHMVKSRHLAEARDRLNEKLRRLHQEHETEGNRFRQHEMEGEIIGIEAGVAELNLALGKAYDPGAPPRVWGYDG